MTMILTDALVALLILLGGGFALVGSWAMVRLPSLMSRLHGPTKATTLGVGGCLTGSMLYFPAHGLGWSAHELLIALFLFITAPVSANMIAKAYIHGRRHDASGDADMPPPPQPGVGWATFGVPEDQEGPQRGTDTATPR